MKHIVEIWSTNKETNKIIGIKTRIEITEEDIENLALKLFEERYEQDSHYSYSASIDKTIID